MAICTDSGCTTTNFDAIGRGSSYINSECIRANLAKAPEAVCIIAIGFNVLFVPRSTTEFFCTFIPMAL